MTVRKKTTTSGFVNEVIEEEQVAEITIESETPPVLEQVKPEPEPQVEIAPTLKPPVAFFPPENPAPVVKDEMKRRNQPRFSVRSGDSWA